MNKYLTGSSLLFSMVSAFCIDTRLHTCGLFLLLSAIGTILYGLISCLLNGRKKVARRVFVRRILSKRPRKCRKLATGKIK